MDHSIIRAAQKKDKKAEKEIFLFFAPKLYGLCRRYANDDHEAEDYIQEIFIRMFEKIQLYDESRSTFYTWFYRLSTNRIIELKRKKKLLYELPKEEKIQEDQSADNLITDVSQQQLLTAIDQLPEGYKNIVNLFVFEQWSHKEIAEKLQIAESTSRSQYSRSKQLLKKILLKSLPKKYEGQFVK